MAMPSLSDLIVDMNNPSTLAYYSQLLLFKNDTSQATVPFDNPSKPEQRVLQSLAHALDLEYDHDTLLHQALISRTSVLDGHLHLLSNAGIGTSPAAGNLVDESNNNVDSMAMQPFWDNNPNRLMDFSSLSHGPVAETGLERLDFQPVDWSTTGMDNLPASQAQQNPLPAVSDDVSVDYSVDTAPSLSEASGIAPFSSTSELYSSRDLSSRNIHDGPQSSSSIYNSDRRSSCQSIHAATSGFFGSHRTASRAASTNSVHGEWGPSRVEKSVSRRSSIRSGASSGFSCFDSRSGSQISVGSGHHGTLGKIARATKKVVTAVKACWRCRILRKGCNRETPCNACPSESHRSDWHTLGCKRGDIKDHMLPIVLCPQQGQHWETTSEELTQHHSEKPEIIANYTSRQGLEKRQDDIKILKTGSLISHTTLIGRFFQGIGMDVHSLDTLRGIPVPPASCGRLAAAALVPLDDCILMIIWELLHNPTSQSIHDGWSVDELFNLLISAALCQVETSNLLIVQSFICLRSCLEVMRIQSSRHLSEACHQTCRPQSCNVECIASLETHLSNYLHELSRVFFLKENMRDIKIWWMSGFYSLCFQSIVRRALLHLASSRGTGESTTRHLAAEQYLQVGVRLFVASSRNHDPLFRDLPQLYDNSSTEKELSQINECKLAQVSVKQPAWKQDGVKGSAAYLKRLFEDDDQVLLTSTAESGTGDLCPEFDSSFKPYSWITKFDTVFLVSDSTTMFENGSWSEISGALSSIMFLVNRYHNYGIDIHFEIHKSLSPGDFSQGIAGGGYYGVKNIATVTEIFEKVRPHSSIATSIGLRDILGPYLTKLERALSLGDEMRPLNLIVIGDDENCNVLEIELASVAKKLDEIYAPRHQVGVQFFKVGQKREVLEAFALLGEGRESMDSNCDKFRDIVSTVEETENSHLSGEGILNANLEAWLSLLET